MKTKKQLKMEALEISYSLLDRVDIGLWDNEEDFT